MHFKPSFITGLSFGLTSGTITTLGLIVGLHAGTQSKLAVIGGVITIAIADAFSDALGIHISQEAGAKRKVVEIWESTAATFISKFVFALTFVLPILLVSFNQAIWISIGWGTFILTTASYFIAKKQKQNPLEIIGEHLLIATMTIIITHFVGDFVHSTFN